VQAGSPFAALQTVPHAPQLPVFTFTSTHAPPQHAMPVPQGVVASQRGTQALSMHA
jgi:hypothetical protein